MEENAGLKMRLCLYIMDKEYLTSFIYMASKIDNDIYFNLDFNGVVDDGELLVTDCDKESFEYKFSGVNFKYVCFIGSSNCEELSNYPFYIFKYQYFKDLISKINICFSVAIWNGNKQPTFSKKIAICYDYDIYKSNYINSLTKQIVYKYGYKTLIFPLEEIFGNNHYLISSLGSSYFKKLVYFIKKGGDVPIESFFRQDNYGVNHFNISGLLNPLPKLDDESFYELISFFTKNYFDVVIFEIARNLSTRNIDLLKMMDDVIVISQNKDCSFFNQIKANVHVSTIDENIPDFELKVSDDINRIFNS